MENNEVFSSEIIRTDSNHKNNLYDLLNVIPAKPLDIKESKKYMCNFTPRTDKIYIPKRRSRAKVKTVRDIRTAFENDTYTYLTSDLELQQNYLLKKIRSGSAKKENTTNIAKKMLQSDAPISRSTWQMLVNLNPDQNVHSRQYVLWNEKYIQINGSIGGKNKLICNHDLAKTKVKPQVKKMAVKTNFIKKNKGLLRNSLSVKFKPGPLRRKKFLDDSHQKYNGDIELVELPKVELLIQPTYGTFLDPTITQFLNDLHKEDGIISEKWAEFAVSVLGKTEKSNAKLVDSESVTFDLKYKYNQHRILVRKDMDNSFVTPKFETTYTKSNTNDQLNILPEIKDMMLKILDAVEISLNQDTMFTTDKDLKQSLKEDFNTMDITSVSKDKAKRKYLELDRLDVTVIQLPEDFKKEPTQDCKNEHCSLGCVCDSLNGKYNFRLHCGREECMFDCKCDFSKYTNIIADSNGSDSTYLIPGIINIEDEINLKLAKEEQKFHQTVIVTGEKNILFKSERRDWKSSKKYKSFYKNMCLKNVNPKKRVLSVTAIKLDCENIEPWCIVHNLYKCFCKGKFTEITTSHTPEKPAKDPMMKDFGVDIECSLEKILRSSIPETAHKPMIRQRRQDTVSLNKTKKPNSIYGKFYSNLGKADEKKRKTSSSATSSSVFLTEEMAISESSDPYEFYYSDYYGTCSRVNPYEGRKYSDGHYKNTNYKIKEMEKNDITLQKKMMSILQTDSDKDQVLSKECNLNYNPEKNVDKLNTAVKELGKLNDIKMTDTDNAISELKEPEKKNESVTKRSSNPNLTEFLYNFNDITSDSNKQNKRLLSTENKLVGWLESSYKLYKKRIDQGLIKTSLEPPTLGKVVLHAWDFILSRYKERKNHFLISKQKPYRIFMGVHTINPFFESCMNINEIRFADLHKYPQTVKNLLTNATDLKDNFCILRGLSHCWELVGSVAKVNKNNQTTDEINSEICDLESNSLFHPSDLSDEQLSNGGSEQVENETLKENDVSLKCPDDAESSKWFIMTLENDFSEIRFYKKGFFVKYESIVKAINVARMSGKTVRLSSQKCADKNSGPQFGIYAIPYTSEYCVFIGPYELQDSLGIETIKSILDVRKLNKTRGFWMYTNKIDNLKVIDNPMSFMPSSSSSFENSQAEPLENHLFEDKHSSDETDKESPKKIYIKECNESETKSLLKLQQKKVVKPIKIRKTNGFYHLATDGLFKKISLHNQALIGASITKSNLAVGSDITKNLLLNALPNKNLPNLENVTSPTKDNVEEGPQLKISAVYSQKEEANLNFKKSEGGMFVLKPEEINRRLFGEQCTQEATEQTITKDISDSILIECPLFQDEDASATITRCTIDNDVCVISDDEDDSQNVLIKCINVNDLGWIWGRRMLSSSLLSIRIPGSGQYTEYRTEKEAFEMLNRELTQIVGPSKPFDFDWKIVELTNDFEGDLNPLDVEHLRQMNTNEGGSPKGLQTLVCLLRNARRTYSRKNMSSPSSSSPSPVPEPKEKLPATAEEVLEKKQDARVSDSLENRLFE